MKRSHFAPVVLLLASAAALVAQEAQKPAAAAKPAAPTAPAAAQEAAPPTFPAQVEQVIVDVVVTDKKGNTIRGLKQERHHRHRGRRAPGGRLVRGGGAARPALRDAPSAAPGLGQHHARGAPGPHVRRPVRRHEHHALEGQPGEGGGGELPREGHPRGRPGDAHLDRRRHLVDGPHGVGPAQAPRHGEALRRALHPRHVPGADVGLGGPAHPRLPRPAGHGARPAALRDLRRRIVPEPAAGQHRARGHRGGPLRHRARLRGVLPGRDPPADDPRRPRARAQRAGRRQGPQVRDPRLRGLHPRPQRGRVQARQRG